MIATNGTDRREPQRLDLERKIAECRLAPHDQSFGPLDRAARLHQLEIEHQQLSNGGRKQSFPGLVTAVYVNWSNHHGLTS